MTKNNLEELILTLLSIRELTHLSVQVIIVNGSVIQIPSETLAINSKFEFEILNGPDNGIYNGMNRGASIAKGDYLWFLNSGDLSIDNNLIKGIVVILKKVKPDLLIGLQLPLLRLSKITFKFQNKLLKIGARPIPHQSTFISKKFFNQLGGYDEKFIIYSDQDFLLRSVINNAKIHRISNAISHKSSGGIGDLQVFGTFFQQIRYLRRLYKFHLSFFDKFLIGVLNLYIQIRRKFD